MISIHHKSVIYTWLFALGLLLLLSNVHAQEGEGGCPPGQSAYDSPDGIPTCGPMQNQPAQPPVHWVDQWGAIATDFSHGSVGTITNMSSRSEAERRALADCEAKGGARCKVEIWYVNQCVTLVAGDTKHITAIGATTDEAIQKGIAECNAGDTNCKAYYIACSQAKQGQ
jgi:hypothetical protein